MGGKWNEEHRKTKGQTGVAAARNCSITLSAKKTLPVVVSRQSWQLELEQKDYQADQHLPPPSSYFEDMCRCCSCRKETQTQTSNPARTRC